MWPPDKQPTAVDTRLQVLELRKEGHSIRQRVNSRQTKGIGMFRQLLERLLETNTRDAHAVQHLLVQALQPSSIA